MSAYIWNDGQAPRNGKLVLKGLNQDEIAMTETGTKLTIIYERRLALFEVRAGTRSANYPFGYLEIYLDRNGKGEGTMIPAARIRLQKDGTWEVEDFGEFPARLLGVQVRQ